MPRYNGILPISSLTRGVPTATVIPDLVDACFLEDGVRRYLGRALSLGIGSGSPATGQQPGQLGSVRNADLDEDAVHLLFDRLAARPDEHGDLTVAHSLTYELRHLGLARAKGLNSLELLGPAVVDPGRVWIVLKSRVCQR